MYQARVGVFIVEQDCVFQDVDGVDPECWHLMGTVPELPGEAEPDKPGLSPVLDKRLVAYCRLVPPGIKFPEPSIGRVITAGAARRAGYGRQLMREAVRQAERLWPGQALRIGAQQYLERFYGEFGFRTVSEPYDEDGILHVEMLRPASTGAGSGSSARGRSPAFGHEQE